MDENPIEENNEVADDEPKIEEELKVDDHKGEEEKVEQQ
jgi:hypothetical protein